MHKYIYKCNEAHRPGVIFQFKFKLFNIHICNYVEKNVYQSGSVISLLSQKENMLFSND